VRKLVKPERIHWCTGTQEEYNELCDSLVQQGTFIRLNDELRPNSFLARTDPRDTGRADKDTFSKSHYIFLYKTNIFSL
jgi:phosphoenolpyruvate carboxykinase (GTP)